MLRRAASNREISRVPDKPPRAPPRSAERIADAAKARVEVQNTEPRHTPHRPPTPTSSPELPEHPAAGTPPHAVLALDRPRLPTLDQLRRRILQERSTTGLTRSASTGAASHVARAFAMQKLLGATSPVPERDMLNVVRGVNAARANDMDSAEQQGAEKRHTRTLEVADQALFVSTAQSQSPDTGADRATRKRATLMRSVSARDVARLHMLRKLERRRDDSEPQTAKADQPAGALGLSIGDKSGPRPASPASPVSPEKTRGLSAFSDDSGISTAHTDRESEPTAIAIGSPGQSDHVWSAVPTRTPLHAPAPALNLNQVPAPAPALTQPPTATPWSDTSPAHYPVAQPPILSVAKAPDPPQADERVARNRSGMRQKPLPSLPTAQLEVPEAMSGVPSPTLMQSVFESTPVHTPIPGDSYGFEASSHYRTVSARNSREDPRDDYLNDGSSREESRGARLLGSLRRKTSRRGLANDSRAHSRSQSMWESVRLRPRHGKQASDAGAHQRVVVTLLGDRSGIPGVYARHVELPLTAATLVRWNRSLPEPFPDVLSHFPAEVPQRLALEPPRRLQRATPVLLAVDDAFVKLRYAFVFDDVLLLLKTVPVGASTADTAGNVMKRLASVPDLYDQFVPIDVIDLQRTEIHGLPPAESPVDADMRSYMRKFVTQFAATPFAALEAAAADTQGVRQPRHTIFAHLLYATPMLDRDTVSDVLYAADQRLLLEAYVSTFRFSGVPIVAALRLLLLDVRFPRDMSAFEVLLLAFAAHWLRENRALGMQYTLELATDLTFAIMALNDALHSGVTATPGLFARRAQLTPETFVASFRENDPAHGISDHMLGQVYHSIKNSPLTPARRAGTDVRTIYIDRATLPLALCPGVRSGPVRVSLDAPDPELRLELYGEDLRCDPPVLTFNQSPTVEFHVTSTGPGTKRVSFVRLGARAAAYTGDRPRVTPIAGSRTLPCWVPLYRDVPLVTSARPARPSLTLVHHTLRQGPLRYTLNLPDSAAMTSLVTLLLDNQRRHAAALERMPARERAARLLAIRVLHTALLGETALEDAGEAGVRRQGSAPVARLANAMPSATGLELVRVARENSLLYSMLVDSD